MLLNVSLESPTCESILKWWHNFFTEVFCWIWNFLLSSSFIGSPVSSFILSLGGKGREGMLGTGDMEAEWGLELCSQERQVSSPSSSSSSSSRYVVGRLPAASQLVTSCLARSETPGRLIWKCKPMCVEWKERVTNKKKAKCPHQPQSLRLFSFVTNILEGGGGLAPLCTPFVLVFSVGFSSKPFGFLYISPSFEEFYQSHWPFKNLISRCWLQIYEQK